MSRFSVAQLRLFVTNADRGTDCAHFVLNSTLYLYYLILCHSVTHSSRA